MAAIAYFATPRTPLTLRSSRGIQTTQNATKSDTLFVFDPNTVSYEELVMLGFDKRTAVGIVKYRTAGKVFGIAEEFALCYGVTDSMFSRIRPYIKIGKEYATKPKHNFAGSFSCTKGGVHAENRRIGGCSGGLQIGVC